MLEYPRKQGHDRRDEKMSGEYEVHYKFTWRKEGYDFIEEKGQMLCNAYESAHAIFKNKCKELMQRVFAICDDDYSYVNVDVYVKQCDSTADCVDAIFFTMEGAEDED